MGRKRATMMYACVSLTCIKTESAARLTGSATARRAHVPHSRLKELGAAT
jgi:hypothetical protein